MEKRLAEAIVDQLVAWDVKYIFGVIGDDILPFLDAIKAQEKLKFIGAAHEAGAAFMASYYAKLTGKLGVCLASAAGTINLLEGLVDASMDSAPVLAITGQVETTKIGSPTKQYFNQNNVYSNFAVYSETAVDAQASVRLVIRAISQAILKKSVAHIALPSDLWLKNVKANPAIIPPLIKGIKKGDKLVGDLYKVLDLLIDARKPLIVVGPIDKKVSEKVRELSVKWGAGIVLAQEAKGLLPDKVVIGGIGQAYMPKTVSEADCILMIGSASYEENFLPQVPIIQIEAEPWLINDKYLWDSLAGDFKYILDKLIEGLKGRQMDSSWVHQVEMEKKSWQELRLADANLNGQPIHPARLMVALSQVVVEDAIIALDEGAFMHWFDRSFEGVHQTILISSFWRSMGIGIPSAIAAKLAFPKKQVVSLVGDGSFLMSLGEFSTIVKYNLPITVIVVRNQQFGLEKDKAEAKGFNPSGLEVPVIDFSQYAVVCGAKGFRVEKPEELKPMLWEALKLGQPVIVDVICDNPRLPVYL